MATILDFEDEDSHEEELDGDSETDSESDDENGGYDYTFVDPGPSDDQMCPICHLVARKARQANCCGKMFCKGCLEKLRQYSNEFNCPICRKSLGKRYFKDKRTEREILHLQIYCTNKKEGCSWQGNLKGIDTHIQVCHNEKVTCDKCNDAMQRHQLEIHNNDECRQRDYKCPHCEADGIYVVMVTSHLEECPDLLLICPNEGCENKIKRREMGSHQQVCPKNVIKCPYHDIGCETEMKREMMDQHMETNTQAHLQNAVKKIAYLQNVVKKVREQQQQKCHVIKFNEFSKHERNKDVWYSPGFYTAAGGYKLRIRLDANGAHDGEGTHISSYVNLMPGEYDDMLEWPFQGKVTVELLNQLEDRNHYKHVTPFNDKTPDKYKTRKKKVDTNEWGLPHFIPHTDLGLNSSTNTQYLMKDTLFFRVSVNVHSKTKPWLAGII